MNMVERSPTQAKLNEALQHMQSALDMLDESGAPEDIGSHLDLAICRLEHSLGCNPPDNSIQQLQTEIENALLGATTDVAESDALLWSSRRGTDQLCGGDRPLMFR